MRIAELISNRWCFAILTGLAISVAFAATASAQPALTITTPSPLPTGILQTPYSHTLEASGGTPPYNNWVLVNRALPDGLSLDSSSGVISGTPTSRETFPFTVQVTDGAQRTVTKSFLLNIAGTLIITSGSPLPNGTLGIPYSQTLAATGGIRPYDWLLLEAALPNGLNLTSSDDSSGLISGTPTSPGIFSFVALVVENYLGCPQLLACPPLERDLKRFDITIDPPLTITTSSPLDIGVVGTPYPRRLEASGGAPPYTWLRSAGLLPPGLVLTSSGPSSGLITGTPTSSGNFNFTAQVTDTVGRTAVRAFDVTIILPPTITTASPLPNGTEGTAYSYTLAAVGGTLPYSWSATGLPSGLTLNSTNGVISGAPSGAGSFGLTVRVTDNAGRTATRIFDIAVDPPPLTVTTASPLLTGTVGTPYSQYLAATGGTPPLTWARSAGSLPAGLGLDPSGLISGTPTSPGSFAFTAQVTDNAQRTARKTFDITINPAPLTITTPSPFPAGMTGTAYAQQQLAATGGTPPYTWARGAGALPAGLDLGLNGLISGTPASPGNFNFTVQVMDSAQRTASKVFDITIDPPPLTITTASLPTGEMRTAYTQQQLEATGGTPPYTWVSLGSLPAGLNLDSSGLIGGTPTISGTFTFTAQVTDTAQRTAIRDFQVAINPPPPPSISITNLPDSAEPSEQPRGNIALSRDYSSSVRAYLGFRFTPDGNLPSDPNIGFLDADGVIRPSIEIMLPADAQPAGFALQTGTIAGVIRITVTSDSGTDITPSPAPTIVVNRRAPVITEVTIGARTASSFEIVIVGYSNIRAVSQGMFRFTARAGSNLQTELIPIDLSNDFAVWYANPDSVRRGSQFRSVTTFTVQGDISALGSVSVTLANAVGTSQPRSANF